MNMSRIPIAALALAALAMPAGAQMVDNDAYARDTSSQVTKNPFGLCWRTYSWTPDKAIAALQQYGGTVIKTSLSEEDTKKLQDALQPPSPTGVS